MKHKHSFMNPWDDISTMSQFRDKNKGLGEFDFYRMQIRAQLFKINDIVN